MKKIISIFKVFLLLGVLATATSCEDFMSTDTNRYMLADDNLINSPNDTVYSIIGIMNKVQKLSDKYVLLGELRGDLLDVSDDTETDLLDINNFTVDASSNSFSDVKDFYAVINNCNYFISRADTTLALNGYKPFKAEVAAAKSIRAWVYMQLVLNYGKAYYFEKPILSISEAKENYPEYGMELLVDKLIPELIALNPITSSTVPGFGAGASALFIDPLFVLGDLYLWKASFTHSVAEYDQAAYYYAQLIKKNKLSVDKNIRVSWLDDKFSYPVDVWSTIISGGNSSDEIISAIALSVSAADGVTSTLSKLSEKKMIVSSGVMDKLFASQEYCYVPDDAATATPKYTQGDLRARGAIKLLYSFSDDDMTLNKDYYITKYQFNNVVLYRTGLLYLRLAEAMNRAGRPGLAFAALKYGLNANTLLASSGLVNPTEIDLTKEYISIFKSELFSKSVGIHNRGCGNSALNAGYIIKDFTRFIPKVDENGVVVKDAAGKEVLIPTTDASELALAKQDSINFVENAICDELALETGFEGNRFQDLMRLSNHRNDPSFLAKKVASKHKNSELFETKLLNKENWYVPVRKY